MRIPFKTPYTTGNEHRDIADDRHLSVKRDKVGEVDRRRAYRHHARPRREDRARPSRPDPGRADASTRACGTTP